MLREFESLTYAVASLSAESFEAVSEIQIELARSSARRGLGLLALLADVMLSTGRSDTVEVLSDFAAHELELSPLEVAKLADLVSTYSERAATILRQCSRDAVEEAAVKTTI